GCNSEKADYQRGNCGCELSPEITRTKQPLQLRPERHAEFGDDQPIVLPFLLENWPDHAGDAIAELDRALIEPRRQRPFEAEGAKESTTLMERDSQDRPTAAGLGEIAVGAIDTVFPVRARRIKHNCLLIDRFVHRGPEIADHIHTPPELGRMGDC